MSAEDRLRLDAQHALGQTPGRRARSLGAHRPRPGRRGSPRSCVEQPRQVVDAQHVGPVGQRPAVGSVRSGSSCISMKSASTPDRHRRARERLHVAALAARAVALPARELHRVGGVEDDRVAELAA